MVLVASDRGNKIKSDWNERDKIEKYNSVKTVVSAPLYYPINSSGQSVRVG